MAQAFVPANSLKAHLLHSLAEAGGSLARMKISEEEKRVRKMVVFLLIFGIQVAARDMESCPMHKNPSQHQSQVEKHGDEAMGFPHDKTTHHFRLYTDGGAIEVTANDSSDEADIQAIRSHLSHVAAMFAEGNFSIPMFIHGQVPTGVEVMKKERSQISYNFEAIPTGARVRITTKSKNAVSAVHDFLRFQIEDPHTGDSVQISTP